MPEIRTAPRSSAVTGTEEPPRVRLVEPVAALSRMSDLARGRPDDEAMRACLLATALGRRLRLAQDELSDVFYTALLRFVGCTATSHEYAATFGGDDVAVRRAGDLVDTADLRSGLGYVFGLSAGRSPVARVRAFASTVPRARGVFREGGRADCEVGALMVVRMGFGDGVRRGLTEMFERWDGLGVPQGLRGAAISTPARIAAVAYVAVMVGDANGADAAETFVRGWSGRALDPDVAAAFQADAAALLAEA